jgi:hypothetical protein
MAIERLFFFEIHQSAADVLDSFDVYKLQQSKRAKAKLSDLPQLRDLNRFCIPGDINGMRRVHAAPGRSG